MKVRSIIKNIAITSAALISFSALADVDTYADANSVTLAGHDAVAYFTQNAAVEGNAHFSAVHDGVIFHFANEENRNTFSANPAKYAPQYGGFCAYGAKLGKKFEVDGKAFEVVEGKLYVNKNLDVYEVWDEDQDENIVEANQQWPEIKAVAANDL